MRAEGELWECTKGGDWASVHLITSAAAEDGVAVDGEGIIDERYGFVQPGYVLVRLNEYIADIGMMGLECWRESVSKSSACIPLVSVSIH